jgi:hypothetical protein
MTTADREIAGWLGEIAAWLEGRARWLRHQREVQMQIDPQWTAVELKPEQFEDIVGGIEKSARGLRSIVDESGGGPPVSIGERAKARRRHTAHAGP